MTDGGATLDELAAVYRRDFGAFVSVAAAIVRDHDAARDVVQEAFARMVRLRASFRGDGSLRGWAWRSVVNGAHSYVRNAARLARTVEEPGPAELVDAADESPVGEALKRLPERQRAAIFLRYYADLDYRSIAEVLDVAPGTVAATLNQAHRRLLHVLERAPR